MEPKSESKLSILAQFDDICRFHNSYAFEQEDAFEKFLIQTEHNRIKWLKCQQQLSKATERIRQLEGKNRELEIKLDRLRHEYAKQMKRGETHEQEAAKYRALVQKISECVNDGQQQIEQQNFGSKNELLHNVNIYRTRYAQRMMNDAFSQSTHSLASSSSSCSSTNSNATFRDRINSIISQFSSQTHLPMETKKSTILTTDQHKMKNDGDDNDDEDDDSLQFDQTEDSIMVSQTNLVPSKKMTVVDDDCNEAQKDCAQFSSPSSTATYAVVTKKAKIQPVSPKNQQDKSSNKPNGDDDQNKNNNRMEIDQQNEDLFQTPHKSTTINTNTALPPSVEVIPWATPQAVEQRRLLRSQSTKKIRTDFSRIDSRPHSLIQKKCFKSMTCMPCGKTINFYSKAVVCVDCRTVAHITCQPTLPLPCIPHFTPKGIGKNRAAGCHLIVDDFTSPDTRPFVPPILVYCIKELERRALQEKGIYRKCGTDREVRELKNKFLHTKTGPPNISLIDPHVLCGVVKMFLRDLDDPLITHILWHDFVRAADEEKHGRTQAVILLKYCIDQLPDANRDTLAFLIIHLHHVASQCANNHMSLESLAKIFAPTIVGNSITNPPVGSIMAESGKQIVVMEALLKWLPVDYWLETLREPEIYKTPASVLPKRRLQHPATVGGINGDDRFATSGTTNNHHNNRDGTVATSTAATANGGNDALSPSTISIYATPMGNGRIARYSPVKPTKLFNEFIL